MKDAYLRQTGKKNGTLLPRAALWRSAMAAALMLGPPLASSGAAVRNPDEHTILLWHLEETVPDSVPGGMDFADASPNRLHAYGADFGSHGIVAGKAGVIGRAVDLVAPNGRNSIRNSRVTEEYWGDGSFTFEAWVRNPGSLESGDATTGRQIAAHEDRDTAWSLGIGRDGALIVHGDTRFHELQHRTTPLEWRPEVWYHVGLVSEASGSERAKYTIYRTPESAMRLTEAGSFTGAAVRLDGDNTNGLTVGGETNPDGSADPTRFDGRVDEVHYSKVARSRDHLLEAVAGRRESPSSASRDVNLRFAVKPAERLALVAANATLIPGANNALSCDVTLRRAGESAPVERLRFTSGESSAQVRKVFSLWELPVGSYTVHVAVRDAERNLLKDETYSADLEEKPGWAVPSGPVSIGAEHQLFVDSYLIESTENVERNLHQVQPYEGNPVLMSTKPWEHRRLVYGSVYYIPEEAEFRMWYMVFGAKDARPPNPILSFKEAGSICYATSRDGVHWQKPELGLKEFRGSKENNIVLLPGGSHFDSTNVMYTPEDRERPFKMMVFQGRWPYRKDRIEEVWGDDSVFEIERHGHFAFHSKNGIRWTPYSKDPIIEASDRSLFGYDTVKEKYTGYIKTAWNDPVSGQRERAHKYGAYSELTGFRNWWQEGPNPWVMHSDELDPPVVEIDGSYGYNYESQYLGINEMRHGGPRRGTIDWEMMVSRDGKHWQRPFREDFLPLTNDPEEWRYGVVKIFSNPPIRRDGELWFYYGGSTESVYPEKASGYGDGRRGRQAICLGKLRLDGFVSVDAGAEPGTLTTVPLDLRGGSLFVNANTARNGGVRVEVLELDGSPVRGFGVGDCETVQGDVLEAQVRWKAGRDLGSLRRPVRLKFDLVNAELYSFWTN